MALTTDIGRRVEIVNIDTFKDITIALYQQQSDQGPVYLVHTYSSLEGADDRIAFVVKAMTVLGGLVSGGEDPRTVRFPCGHDHLPACRQLFMRACQIDQTQPLEALPLVSFDKKSDQEMTFEPLGAGQYRLTGIGTDDKQNKRLKTISKLIVKRGGLTLTNENIHLLQTSCGEDHDALLGLLLYILQRVRVSSLVE